MSVPLNPDWNWLRLGETAQMEVELTAFMLSGGWSGGWFPFVFPFEKVSLEKRLRLTSLSSSRLAKPKSIAFLKLCGTQFKPKFGRL